MLRVMLRETIRCKVAYQMSSSWGSSSSEVKLHIKPDMCSDFTALMLRRTVYGAALLRIEPWRASSTWESLLSAKLLHVLYSTVMLSKLTAAMISTRFHGAKSRTRACWPRPQLSMGVPSDLQY